jgi:hypothetical protein
MGIKSSAARDFGMQYWVPAAYGAFLGPPPAALAATPLILWEGKEKIREKSYNRC